MLCKYFCCWIQWYWLYIYYIWSALPPRSIISIDLGQISCIFFCRKKLVPLSRKVEKRERRKEVWFFFYLWKNGEMQYLQLIRIIFLVLKIYQSLWTAIRTILNGPSKTPEQEASSGDPVTQGRLGVCVVENHVHFGVLFDCRSLGF